MLAALITQNIVDMSYLDAVIQDLLEEMKEIQLSREYFNGEQDTSFITIRVAEFLSIHTETKFRLNVCQGVVQALANELEVVRFDTDETPNENNQKPQAVWANQVFKWNDLESLQTDLYEAALADRESFIIVEYDQEKGHPVLTHNPRLVQVEAGGDGMGVVVIYENDDIYQKPLYAVKEWIETTYDTSGIPTSVTRRTVYYPDRIERFLYDYGWKRIPYSQVSEDEEGSPTFIQLPYEPWLDQKGEPLGIPVIHFPNKSLVSEHWEAIPVQDAINKTFVDVLAANDLTAFKSFFVFGFYPTTDGKEPKADGSNMMKIGPGQVNGTTATREKGVDFKEIEGADNTPLLEALQAMIMFVAQITDTPVTRFITSAQIASSETIMAQKQALRDKARNRRMRWGPRWAQVLDVARKLENFFGELELDENVEFKPIWKSDKSLDEISQKITKLEITQKQAWKEAGYTDEEIKEMEQEPEYLMKKFTKILEGYEIASRNGFSLESYLRTINLPEDQIVLLVNAQGTALPPVGQ